MFNKCQIIFIHGGTVFANKKDFYDYLLNIEYNPKNKESLSWREWLKQRLIDTCDCLIPTMPNKQWADYQAWKIWFERQFPFLDKDKQIILIGHSLGGMFLVKYLSENKFPKKVSQLHLVSPVFDNSDFKKQETLGNFLFNPKDLKNLEKQSNKIFLYHSTDDKVVSFKHAEKYLQYLPKIKFFKFRDRGHFRDSQFLEILQIINKNL